MEINIYNKAETLVFLHLFIGEGNLITNFVLHKNSGLSYAHVSKIIKKLERRELINRDVDDSNMRRKPITLTDKGREIAKRFYEICYEDYNNDRL